MVEGGDAVELADLVDRRAIFLGDAVERIALDYSVIDFFRLRSFPNP